MEFVNLFFSYRGRVGRTIYWCGLLTNSLALLLLILIVESWRIMIPDNLLTKGLRGLIMLAGFLAFGSSTISLQIRRAHDRGFEGWWGAIGFAAGAMLIGIALTPYPSMHLLGPASIILLLVFLVLGVPAGEEASNRFGPPPRDMDAQQSLKT